MKIKIHYSLFIIFIIFLYSGFILEFTVLLLTLIMHELSHMLMARLFNQKTRQIKLSLIGGVLDLDIRSIGVLKELLIYSAGICMNILIIIFANLLNNSYIKDLIINYNSLLIIVNLIPIYPLDGFRIIDSLSKLMKKPYKEYKIMKSISITSLIILSIYLFIININVSYLIVISYLIIQNFEYIRNRDVIVLKRIVRYSYK